MDAKMARPEKKWSVETLHRNIIGNQRAIAGVKRDLEFNARTGSWGPRAIVANESYLRVLERELTFYQAEWEQRTNKECSS